MDKYEERRLALAKLRDELGHGGIRSIAERIGKDPSYVSRMLYPQTKKGYKRIGEDLLDSLNEAYPGWLNKNMNNNISKIYPKRRIDHIKLPILEISPSAGAGGEPADYPAVIDYMEVPEIWAQHKLGRDLSKYRVLPVSGDSMSPTINDGDLVFVDTNIHTFGSEGIYIIVWNDRLLIKRLRAVLATQRVEIRSDNEGKYGVETVSIEEAEKLHICGLVRCWWSIKTA